MNSMAAMNLSSGVKMMVSFLFFLKNYVCMFVNVL